MEVRKIILDGFRNYDWCEANFTPGVNVIIGENAQGKTNLLESVYMLTGGRSFRTHKDSELIGFARDDASIFAEIDSAGRGQKIEIKMRRGVRKQIFLNDVRLKKAGELSGRMTAVLFSPDDLELIRSGASARRNLMNGCITQLRPKYADALSRFNRAHEHKTRILRDMGDKPSLLDALDEFSYEMLKRSAELIYYRAHFSKKLAAAAERIHSEFSGGRETLSVSYKTVKTVSDPFARPQEIYPQLIEHYMAHKRAELESGLCLSGAHKDDLIIEINGREARSFASQGQTRTAALSLKLAEREIHYEDRGEYPILLLDDVLSELDAQRQGFVLNRIGGGQVLITCCEDEDISRRTGGNVIRIANGEVC